MRVGDAAPIPVINMTPDEIEAVIPSYASEDFPGRNEYTIHLACRWVSRWASWMRRRNHKEITAETLRAYCEEVYHNYAPATAENYWIYVKRFLCWLERTNRITESPHRMFRTPASHKFKKRESARRPVTKEEYMKLRQCTSDHWMGWIIMLGWHTGMAMVDCISLRWGSVDMEQCFIKIARVKTGADSVIPFSPSDELGRELFARWETLGRSPNPDDFVSREAGMRFDRVESLRKSKAAQAAFEHIRARAGLPHVTFHGIRHAYISMLANSNMSTILASKVSGHVDPRIFARYVHVDVDKLREQVISAREKADLNSDIAVDSVPAYRSMPSRDWHPNRLYMVKGSVKITFPDGTRVRYVFTSADAEGKKALVTPCDEAGAPVSSAKVLCDINDVRVFK